MMWRKVKRIIGGVMLGSVIAVFVSSCVYSIITEPTHLLAGIGTAVLLVVWVLLGLSFLCGD